MTPPLRRLYQKKFCVQQKAEPVDSAKFLSLLLLWILLLRLIVALLILVVLLRLIVALLILVVLRLLLTGGQIHDSECAVDLLSKVNLDGKTILGDKAFCSAQIRNFIRERKAVACIPDKINSLTIATRYDKLLTCFENFVLLAAILIQI